IVSFGDCIIQIQCPKRGGFGRRISITRRTHPQQPEYIIGMRETCVGLRIDGLEFNGFLKQINALIETFLRGPAAEIAAFDVRLECPLTYTAVALESHALLRRDLNLNL